MSQFFVVQPSQIEVVWPKIEDGVADAVSVSHGEGTVDDVKAGLLNGATTLLMLVDDGVAAAGIVVGLYNFPQFKIARVLLLFGSGLDKMDEAVKRAEDWARSNGCKCVEGWVATQSRIKLFSKFGYKPVYEILRKEL